MRRKIKILRRIIAFKNTNTPRWQSKKHQEAGEKGSVFYFNWVNTNPKPWQLLWRQGHGAKKEQEKSTLFQCGFYQKLEATNF